MPGFVTCGPNEAIIISGCCHSRPLMIPGGRAFVWPWVHKMQKISLNSMTITIESSKVNSQQGVPLSVTGIAQIKVEGRNAEALRAASELFLSKNEDQIKEMVGDTLEGHQRSIIASMTVEDIYKNRKKFSKKVFEVASSDLIAMGFTVISYTIRDVSDEEGYLRALGMARTAEVKRDARIGEAEAKRDAIIHEAIAEEQLQAAKSLNEAEIAKAHREFEIKKAANDIEVFTKRAECDAAAELQRAKTQQRIKDETMQIEVIKRQHEILLAEQEAILVAKKLESEIKLPAEAEKLRVIQLAQTNQKIAELMAETEADSIRMIGEAKAYAIECKGRAEKENIARRADAFKEYEEAARIKMILDALPTVAGEVSRAVGECNKITMVSTGDGDIGPAKFTGEVLDIITRIGTSVHSMTGRTINVNLPPPVPGGFRR